MRKKSSFSIFFRPVFGSGKTPLTCRGSKKASQKLGRKFSRPAKSEFACSWMTGRARKSEASVAGRCSHHIDPLVLSPRPPPSEGLNHRSHHSHSIRLCERRGKRDVTITIEQPNPWKLAAGSFFASIFQEIQSCEVSTKLALSESGKIFRAVHAANENYR